MTGVSEDLVPLSFQQEWGWRLLQSGDAGWFMPYSFRIFGDLDLDHLRVCLNIILAKHESLRTRIVCVDDRPMQKILSFEDCALTVLDLRGRPSREREVASAVATLFASRVNLNVGPLFVVSVARLSVCENVMAVAIHHEIFDRMSAVILFQELWALYEDRSLQAIEHESVLQYRHYALWQRERHKDWSGRHAKYWMDKLDRASRVHMPRDVGLEAAGSKASEFRLYLDKQSSSALGELATAEGVFLGLIVLSTFAVVTSRWGAQRDFLLPFVVSGRDRPEHLNTVGFFAYPIYLRVRFTGSETFRDALKQVTDEFFKTWGHADSGRICGTQPLELLNGVGFQWMSWKPHQIRGTPSPPHGYDKRTGLIVEPYTAADPSWDGQAMEAELWVEFWEGDDGIRGFGNYRRDLFAPQSIQRFVGEWVSLCQQVVRDPLMPVFPAVSDLRCVREPNVGRFTDDA
jgi:condensation domain-containing protein